MLERARVQLKNDFEKWLMVMVKQKQDTMKSPVSGGGMAGSSVLNQSTASGFAATDKRVNENLEAFYKARNEIYK
jgi:hypothetical protein